MASPVEDNVFAKLQHVADPEVQAQREAEVNRKIHEHYAAAQLRQSELISSNTTKPVFISSFTVQNATNTRRSFLKRIFDPLLSANREDDYTLEEALKTVWTSIDKLERFGIYHTPIEPFLQAADPTDPNSTPDDLTVFLNVREKSRLVASSGASVGSNDGSVNFNLLLRNLFGGAETFNANAAFGTRTRSAYSAAFDTPVLSKPNVRWEIAGLANATIKSWASHEEALKGGLTKLKWITDNGHQHELSYSGIWRQVTSLAEKASPTVRADAGDSFKSSLTHTWLADRRDNPLLPTRGYLMKTVAELAGFGPLRGDVAFAKLELESQTAIPIPGVSASASGVSLTAGFRAGMLYPLVLGGDANNNNNTPQHSRINDRFTLGGPTDVRGFRHAGLGPRDAADSVGGDVYAAAGASLLLPLPRVGVDVPLRLQFFVNGGRLLALKHDAATSAQSQSQSQSGGSSTSNAMRATIAQLSDGAPSSAAGVGIVYANPMARFELNFSLPLVVRRGEEARKGLSLGVGFSFL